MFPIYRSLASLTQQQTETDTQAQTQTRASVSSSVSVSAAPSITWVWLGNRWGSAPDRAYNHDLLFISPLTIFANGTIAHVDWQDSVVLQL